MPWRIGCSLLMALAMAPSDARAQTILAQNGDWAAYSTISDRGTPLCGMRVLGADRSLHIKWFQGDTVLTFQAFRNTWSIPRGTSMPLVMRIGREEWRAPGATGHGNMVQWLVDRDEVNAFEAAFRAGLRMTLHFPAGTEAHWEASLIGSAATSSVFVRCMRSLNQQPTQPHARPAPSQPTQPFRQSAPEPTPVIRPGQRT